MRLVLRPLPLLLLAAAAPSPALGPSRRVSLSLSAHEVLLTDAPPHEIVIAAQVTLRDGTLAHDADVVLHTTGGEIVGIEELRPGEWTARLRAPAERFPQVVVVTAADVAPLSSGSAPEITTAVVAYSAQVQLSGKTESRAQMEVRVAGKRFGPVAAGADGRFVLDVMVPPGENWGTGIATDSLGNASRSRINLYLPEVQRLHSFLYPPAVTAGSTEPGYLYVTSVTAAGAPETAALQAISERGAVVGAKRLTVGVTRFKYRAPREVGEGLDRLTVVFGKAREEIQVPIVAAAPEHLAVELLPSPTPADGTTPTDVRVLATDIAGNLCHGHAVVVADGDLRFVATPQASGGYVATLPPRTQVGRAAIRVRLTPSTPVCLRGRLVEIDGHRHLVDAQGVGCRGELRVLDAEAKATRVVILPADGQLPAELALPADASIEIQNGSPRRIHLTGSNVAPVLETVVTAEWRLPTPVTLGVKVVSRNALQIRLRVDVQGMQRPVERLELSATHGVPTVVSVGEAWIEFEVPATPDPLTVMVQDKLTGVSALLRVMP